MSSTSTFWKCTYVMYNIHESDIQMLCFTPIKIYILFINITNYVYVRILILCVCVCVYCQLCMLKLNINVWTFSSSDGIMCGVLCQPPRRRNNIYFKYGVNKLIKIYTYYILGPPTIEKCWNPPLFSIINTEWTTKHAYPSPLRPIMV